MNESGYTPFSNYFVRHLRHPVCTYCVFNHKSGITNYFHKFLLPKKKDRFCGIELPFIIQNDLVYLRNELHNL